jgi:hypothetical protein
MRAFDQALLITSKFQVWLHIVADLGLWSPTYIANADPDNVIKYHNGGRRENKREPREMKPIENGFVDFRGRAYAQAKHGYLVRVANAAQG